MHSMLFIRTVPSALQDLQGLSHRLPSSKFFLYFVIILSVQISKKLDCIIFPIEILLCQSCGQGKSFIQSVKTE